MRTAVKMTTVLRKASVSRTLDSYLASLKPSLWLEADKITGLSNNDPIGTWEDYSTSGLDVSGATTRRPVYIASGLNGLPVVRFNGTTNALTRDNVAMSSLFSTENGAWYLLMKQNGAQSHNVQFSWYNGTDTSGGKIVTFEATFADVIYFDWGAQGLNTGRISVAQPSGWDDAWHIVEFHANEGVNQIVVDGVTLKSQAITQALIESNAKLVIGALNVTTSVSFPCAGDFAYIVGFREAHDEDTRARIRTLTEAKYNPFP